jgi:ATP-dependent RNA helicase DeaD
MLNMGFIEEVEEIMSYTGSSKRTLLFSATMPERIKKLASKYMKESKHLKTTGEQLVTGLTEQIFFEVKACDKFEALCRIIDFEEDFYGLIFCRTRNDVDSLAIKLENRGYGVGGIHGDISQGAREKALKKFREQRISILAATDVAARGIDVSNLTHVINYSLPQDPEAYVHRIGRTGRAGKQGTAITFITPGEYKKLMFIQRSAKTNIKKSKIPEIKDIIQAKKRKITEELSNITQGEISQEFYKLAKTLIAENNPTEILAALLNHSFQNELNPDSYAEINEPRKGKPVDEKGKARLFAALGKKDGITPARLLQLIAEKTGIKKSQVRDIQIMKKFSFMNVSFEDAEKIIAAFRDEGGKPLFTHAQKDKAAKKKHRGK